MTCFVFRGQVVLPDGVLPEGQVVVSGTRIASLTDLRGLTPAERDRAARPAGCCEDPVWIEVPDGYICPGFLDGHVHGGGGADFADGDPEADLHVCQVHARHGTTGLLATTVTAPPADILRAIAAARVAIERGPGLPPIAPGGGPRPTGARILGYHIEGPYIHPDRRGAQNLAHVRRPDPEEMASWLEAGGERGPIWVVTLAPEVEGGLEAVRFLRARGVRVAAGHTDATYAQMETATEAGVTALTHTFNAMRPLHHREPGTVGAALSVGDLFCEIIADGVHVHPGAIRVLLRARGWERVQAVTDAMAAAGLGDGRYTLGNLPVEVRDGVARLADSGALAGSTLTMDRAVANLVRMAGVPVHTAVAMASLVPARRFGLDPWLGSLEPGKEADITVLDRDFRCVLTLVAGVPVFDGR